jgi:hypothetical protein
MVSRRDWLRITAGAGATLSLNPRVLEARQSQEVITRAIPSTGERLPAVGLGGAPGVALPTNGEAEVRGLSTLPKRSSPFGGIHRKG